MSQANSDLTARTLVYYVLGFTADEQSRLQWDAAGALVDDQSVLATNPNGRFAFGLHLLVDGIGAHPEVSRLADTGVPAKSVDNGIESVPDDAITPFDPRLREHLP